MAVSWGSRRLPAPIGLEPEAADRVTGLPP